jgi:hypothetical protein
MGGALAKGLVAAAPITGAAAAGNGGGGSGVGAGVTAAGRKLAGGAVSPGVKPRGVVAAAIGAVVNAVGNGGGVGAGGGRSPPMAGDRCAGSIVVAVLWGPGAASAGAAMSLGAGARRSSPDGAVENADGDVAGGTAARAASVVGSGGSAGMAASVDGVTSPGIVASAGSGGTWVSIVGASADASRIGSSPVPGKRPGGANRDVRPSGAGDVGMGRGDSGASSVAGRVG